MSFDLDPTYMIYGFAVVSAILFGEGAYLLFFSAASYRNRINRRLALLNDTVDRQSILVQIRKERGLTTSGDFRLPMLSFNQLIVQSGLSVGLSRIALFGGIGAVGVLIRRNAIVLFMCVELMLNAANLALVTFSRINGSLDGQIMAFFSMVIAAAEVVVGLAIIMSIFRTRRSASVDDANLLKY